ncbi:UNVERIFIED_CONTAM: hypothetical protein RMT77_005511 [Armadillidium vulgare]
MEIWLKTCLLLCSYGFFKELRPSEPFLTEYLLGPQQNLTSSEVYYDVYPVWTYSYLALLILVFLLTDLLRYKPVIVFEGIGYVATWCLLLWAGGVRWMQFMEFCYGIATATEVAYYTYIYAQVDARHYQKVTSYTRSAILAGRFASGLLSQVLFSTGLMDYHTLNYISLASVIVAFFIATILPPVKTSIYFHRERDVVQKDLQETEDLAVSKANAEDEINERTYAFEDQSEFKFKNFKKVVSIIWNDFREAYSSTYLLKWSIWWAFATCINFQVGNYIQPLWESLAPFHSNENLYNGAVEAVSTLLGALTAFGIGYLHLNWALVGELTLAAISLFDGVLLVIMGFTSEIWVGYVNYIVFRVSYQILITVASYQVAKELRADCYGLVFGINMFLALLFQSILTFIVAEWLEIEPGLQFVIYGGYFGVLALVFFFFAFYGLASLGCEGIRRAGLWERSSMEADRNEAPVGTTEAY